MASLDVGSIWLQSVHLLELIFPLHFPSDKTSLSPAVVYFNE